MTSVASQAISAKYTSLGGSSGFLGTALTTLTQDVGASGFHIDYKGGSIYWSEATGAHAIYGDIRIKWLAQGGPRSGIAYPTTDEASTADGVCRFNNFNGGAIYWTAATGAALIYGEIYKKWMAQGGEQSGMAYPITDETDAPDKRSRFNVFKNGAAIYWSAADGAHMIYGEIYKKWFAAGQGLGYPITDELDSGDKKFRYNLLKNGAAVCWEVSRGAHIIYGEIFKKWMSIGGIQSISSCPITDELPCPGGRYNDLVGSSLYWTAANGAFLVYGDIRKRWLQMGGPSSWLGLPLSDEVAIPNGRSNRFQRGVMNWFGSFDNMRTEPDFSGPSKQFPGNITSGGLAALGGWLNATIYSNGLINWRGDGHDSGADGYKYSVTAILHPPTGSNIVPIALVHRGSVGGTFTSGSRDDPWNEISFNALVAVNFNTYINSRLEVNIVYSSDILTAFESALSFLASFAIGSLTGPVGAVIFVGLEVGSLITTGSAVPGARVFNSILWIAGPDNMLLAFAADAIAAIGSRSRRLTDAEYQYANTKVYAGSLPPIGKILLTDTIGQNNRAFTLPHWDGQITLNMGQAYDRPIAFDSIYQTRRPDGHTFIHELAHSWQIQHTPMQLSLLTQALALQLKGQRSYDYGAAGAPFASFNIEAQAQMVADWVFGLAPNTVSKVREEMDKSSPYYTYILNNIQSGIE